MKIKILQFALLIIALLHCRIAFADIFMCADKDGRKTYHTSSQDQKDCNQLDLETDEEKLTREREANDFPKMGMKIYDNKMLCVNYGKTLRGEKKSYFISAKDDLILMRKELLQRKLSVKDSIIKLEKIKLGISVCSLYASWGNPRDENVSVGSWGTHTQHIFANNYVYSENGKITSWQQ